MDKEKELLIGSMSDIAVRNLAAYTDNRIALIEDLQNLSSYGAVRTGIVVITLCLKGKASLYLNGDSYAMYPNDLLICHPNIIVEKSMVSVDVDFRCICLSPEYVHQLTVIGNNSWDVMKFLENTPILSLKAEEVQLFCQYYDLIRSKLTGTPCRHQKEVIDALLHRGGRAHLHEPAEGIARLHLDAQHIRLLPGQDAGHKDGHALVRADALHAHRPICHARHPVPTEENRQKHQGDFQRTRLPQSFLLR